MLLEEFLKPMGLTQVDAAHKMGICLNRLNELTRRNLCDRDTCLEFALLGRLTGRGNDDESV
jgi:plasmid maintenance system antidote protein VapI